MKPDLVTKLLLAAVAALFSLMSIIGGMAAWYMVQLGEDAQQLYQGQRELTDAVVRNTAAIEVLSGRRSDPLGLSE